MMRLFYLLALFPLHTFCQSDSLQLNASGKYELTGFIPVAGVAADNLYAMAKTFTSNEILSGKAYQVNDDRTKTITRNGSYFSSNSIGYTTYNSRMESKIIIQCQQGGYKYSISNYKASWFPNSTAFPLEDNIWTNLPVYYKIKAVAASHSLDLLSSLRKHIDPTWKP